MNDLFSSDFEQLAVGDEFSTYGRTITEADLSAFAGLTGDHHPLHTDAEWAAGSPFGGRIAHGMLLLSCSVGLAPIDPERVVALRGFERVTFKRPVRIGDTISLRGRVDEVRPLDELSGLVGLDWKVLNQEGRLVVRATAWIIWRRAPEGEPTIPEHRQANVTGEAQRSTGATPEPVYL